MRNKRSQDTGLTIKEENFCNEYINNGGNATKAYESAFGRGNKNQNTLNTTAYRLHRNERITARIKAISDERSRTSVVKREEATMALVAIARFDMGRLYKQTEDGMEVVKSLAEMNEEERRMIQGFDKNGHPVIMDKMQAMKLIASINGLTMPNKVEVSMVGGKLGQLLGGHATPAEGEEIDEDYSYL